MFYKFEHPLFIWLLVATIPALLLFFFIHRRWRKRTLNSLGNNKVLQVILPRLSKTKSGYKFLLKGLAIISVMAGLANLQYGTKVLEVEKKGVDIIMALDVSNSMLAEDLSPNRLTKAKRAIYQLIKTFKNDRIGIVIFAGEAFVQLPLTSDYSAAKLFLEDISTETIATQGTDISKAIYLASKSFNLKSKTNKVIVVITDGEHHEENIDDAIEAARAKGISTYAIGMGSEKGAPIPNYVNGKKTVGFKSDKSGNTVVSKLNAEMLKNIADKGDGVFIRATNSNVGLRNIMKRLNQLEKKAYGSKTFQSQEDNFQIFILIAIISLLLDALVSKRKSKRFNKINLFE